MLIDAGNAMIYHPELGEEPAERLFYMEHNFRSLGVPVFHCLISGGSSDKLRRDDLVATRVLLD